MAVIEKCSVNKTYALEILKSIPTFVAW